MIHTAKILRLSEGLPIIDDLFAKTGCGGMVTMEKAEVIKYTTGT